MITFPILLIYHLMYTGSNHLYVFMNPLNPVEPEDINEEISWEFAQKEIAQAKGFATGVASGLSKGRAELTTITYL